MRYSIKVPSTQRPFKMVTVVLFLWFLPKSEVVIPRFLFPSVPHLLGDCFPSSTYPGSCPLGPCTQLADQPWVSGSWQMLKVLFLPVSGFILRGNSWKQRHLKDQWNESLMLRFRAPDAQREQMFLGRKAALSSHPSNHMPRALPVMRPTLFSGNLQGTAGLASK